MDTNLAVLIDGDNIPSAHVKEMMEEIAKYGNPTIKRIYGDWTKPHLSKWKNLLLENAITPIQQYGYTTGKNATDSTMIIDAMDLLYTRKFDGFCLVTSDSDFTGLAVRLREEGLTVFGFGEKKTPEPFRNACHKFVFTEIFRPSVPASMPPAQQGVQTQQPEPQALPVTVNTASTEGAAQVFPREFVMQALDSSVDDSGWAHLGTFGSYLTKLQPDFDSRHYGFKKLSDLVKAKTDLFATEERTAPGSQQKVLYLRAQAPIAIK